MQRSSTHFNSTDVERFLHRYGIKPTPQRMVIAQYVLNSKSHPTAEQVYQEVGKKLPVLLSRATIYNTLNALAKAGAIKEVHIEAGPARYDAKLADHHHFVDVKTGEIVDLDFNLVKGVQPQLGSNFKVERYSVTFFGELDKSE